MKHLILTLLFLTTTLHAVEPNHAGKLPSSDWLESSPAGFSYLTTSTCAVGFTTVEDGFIQLGSSPNTTATGSNTKNLNHAHGNSFTGKEHYHSESGPGAGLTAGNSASSILNHNHSTNTSDQSFQTTSGSGLGVPGPTNDTNPATSSLSDLRNHTHPISGNVGDVSSGNNGDTNLSLNGSVTNNTDQATVSIEPRKIVMRLCVKNV